MVLLRELGREAEEAMEVELRPPTPCGCREEPGSPEHKQGTVSTAEMPRLVHEGQMKAQGLLGGVFPPPGSLEHIYRACLDTRVGRPRAQAQGLGKGISHAGKRPRGKRPVIFRLCFRG